MRKKSLLIIAASLMALCSLPAQAQYTRSGASSHHGTGHVYNHRNHKGNSDMLSVRLRESGTLEEEVGPDMFSRVRYLRIDGPLDSRDFKFLRRLLNRSKCLNERDKSVDNYIDLDLERAFVYAGSSSRRQRDVLEDRAFESCSHLRSVVLPERLRIVGKRAFGSCGRLEEVYMPSTVQTLGEYCFESCYDLVYIDLPEGLEIIGDKCFDGCNHLAEVMLPNSLREIGKSAFRGTAIKSISLPAGTGIVGNNLGNISSLREIRVAHGSLYYSGDGVALYDRDGVTLLQCPPALTGSFTVPDGVEVIGENAFHGSRLTNIMLPASLTSIEQYAFYHCPNLSELDIPDGVQQIPPHAFDECSAMRYISLPNITQLGAAAFKECRTLQEITLDGSFTMVPKQAFDNCKSLTTVVLPTSVTLIDEKAFHDCIALTEINLADTRVTEIKKEALRNCKSLTHLELPATTTTLGKEALRECKSLTSIDLNQVRSIGENALRETAITTLVLPATVTSIGKKITEKCSNLQRIECHATTPPSLDKVSNDKVPLAVPAGSVATYQTTKPWKEFKTIQSN